MSRRPAILVLAALLSGCVQGQIRRPIETQDPDDTTDTEDDTSPIDTAEDCPEGRSCNPIVVDHFPFLDSRDTTVFSESEIDTYACAPATDESGPELFFAVTVPEAGMLAARLDDPSGVDIDLHLLSADQTCVTRSNDTIGWYVSAGTYLIVADSWVDGTGDVMAGPFDLDVDFVALDSGPCTVDPRDIRMYWTDCAPGIDCTVIPENEPADRVWLTTPAFGPVVLEAHLVTPDDQPYLTGGWPTSFTDGIQGHYDRAVAATGYTMDRDQPWAPNGEGNQHYGQGATGLPVPVEDETWYVNMYWRERPAKGTRMLVLDPFTGRAVVASGGYESGPGSNTAIGGATEEIHDWIGTNHRDELVMAFLVDQSLPLGPIDCTP